MRIFLVSGTQANETRFAAHVANWLGTRLASEHEVVRVALPTSSKARRKLGIQDSWRNYRDGSAISVHNHLLKLGFNEGKDLVLDVHENPVNWAEVWPQHSDFYLEHVQPAIQASLRAGRHGLYFAEVRSPTDYEDIRLMRRKEISFLASRETNIVRIEVPVEGVRDARRKAVVAHDARTKNRFGAQSREEFGKKLGEIIYGFLKLGRK